MIPYQILKTIQLSSPVNVGESVRVMRTDCDVHHNFCSVVRQCCQFLALGTSYENRNQLVTLNEKIKGKLIMNFGAMSKRAVKRQNHAISLSYYFFFLSTFVLLVY